MPKTAMIRARVEPRLKKSAETVLRRVGLTPTEAVRLFYRQVTLQGGLPFAVRIPNAKTRKAMGDALKGNDLTEWSDVGKLRSAHR